MKRLILSLAIILTAGISAQAQTKECDNCHGSGLEYRTCAFCKGEGYRECDFCLGKKIVRCNMCQGAKLK
jgi:DnaJ-class molecular chaperone